MAGRGKDRVQLWEKVNKCQLGQEEKLTSYHTYWITNFQSSLEHKIRHQPMYALEAGKCLRGIIGSNELLKNGGCQTVQKSSDQSTI